jgi:hypothetical protein
VLYHSPLNNSSQFEALSYTWGDPTATSCIVLEGAPFKVTRNLKSALRHLRHQDTARTLWVDAICIDQSNIPERNLQVRRMGVIYDQPRNVIVWLGPEANDSNKAIEKLIEIGQILGKDDLYREKIATSYGPLHGNGPHEPRVWEAVREFFNRPWWSRLWTIQEASSSARADFICGNKTIDFEVLEKAINVIKPVPLALLSLSGPTKTGHDVLISTKFRQADFLFACKRARLSTESSHPMHFRLSSLLDKFRIKNATDPRDMVYAILNLANIRPELTYLLIPNYALTVEHVYTRTAKYIILEENNLNLFGSCTYSHSLDLPSWVPAWNCQGNHEIRIEKWKGLHQASDFSGRYFNSSGGRAIQIQFENHDRTLVVKGINFDKIFSLGQVSTRQEFFEDPKLLSNWLSLAMLSRTIYKGDQVLNSFTSTAQIDLRWDLESFTRGARNWFARQHSVVALHGNRRFVVTTGGLFALVPSLTKSGDIFCVLYGSEVPCVLRADPHVTGNFRLIGECYVHEKMDGQVTADLTISSLKEEVFRII